MPNKFCFRKLIASFCAVSLSGCASVKGDELANLNGLAAPKFSGVTSSKIIEAIRKNGGGDIFSGSGAGFQLIGSLNGGSGQFYFGYDGEYLHYKWGNGSNVSLPFPGIVFDHVMKESFENYVKSEESKRGTADKSKGGYEETAYWDSNARLEFCRKLGLFKGKDNKKLVFSDGVNKDNFGSKFYDSVKAEIVGYFQNTKDESVLKYLSFDKKNLVDERNTLDSKNKALTSQLKGVKDELDKRPTNLKMWGLSAGALALGGLLGGGIAHCFASRSSGGNKIKASKTLNDQKSRSNGGKIATRRIISPRIVDPNNAQKMAKK